MEPGERVPPPLRAKLAEGGRRREVEARVEERAGVRVARGRRRGGGGGGRAFRLCLRARLRGKRRSSRRRRIPLLSLAAAAAVVKEVRVLDQADVLPQRQQALPKSLEVSRRIRRRRRRRRFSLSGLCSLLLLLLPAYGVDRGLAVEGGPQAQPPRNAWHGLEEPVDQGVDLFFFAG